MYSKNIYCLSLYALHVLKKGGSDARTGRRGGEADLTGTRAAILGVGNFTRKALVLVVVFGSAYSDY